MKTPICPTCGCSLVRLGTGMKNAAAHSYENEEYHFFCDGCVEQFITDPGKYLRETGSLIVCPVCLTEKPLDLTTKLEFERDEIHFCRCPLCLAEFNKNPEYYINRLAGQEVHPGTF